jgi:hypothetical protein
MRIGSNTIFGILAFIAVVFASLILQSTLVNGILSVYLYPDILLVMVVYVGLRRELTEGIIWTLFVSYTYSMHSGLSSISSSLLMLLVFFFSRYIGRNFYLLTEKEYFLGMAVPIFAQKLALSLWLHWYNTGVFFVPILQSVTTTVTSSLFGLLILKMLTAIDIWSGRLDETSLIGKKG